jgi:hypothetical protein
MEENNRQESEASYKIQAHRPPALQHFTQLDLLANC